MSGSPGLPPVLLIGGGKMGGAMLSGWLEEGLAPSIVIDPAPEAARLGRPGIQVFPELAGVPEDFRPEAVVFAVKPYQADEALPGCRRFAGEAVMLSIMAGRRLAGLRGLLGPEAALVRAMPNTPAAIRQGITVACPAPGLPASQRRLCDRLLGAIGGVEWVAEESMIDAVTGVSGSGPAYVFLLAELLERAAKAEGLPDELARILARRTVSGAGALLAASEEDASALRIAVTSPKGTTERALDVLMADDAWPRLVQEAVSAAVARSREIGQ